MIFPNHKKKKKDRKPSESGPFIRDCPVGLETTLAL